MRHPLGIHYLQQDHTLQLTKRLCTVVGFPVRICLQGALRQELLDFILSDGLILLTLVFQIPVHGDPAHEVVTKPNQVPVFLVVVVDQILIHCRVDQLLHHLENILVDIVSVQHGCTLLVDDLTLLVHNVVVVEDILPNRKVSALHLLLGGFDDLGEHPALDGHVLLYVQSTHHVFQTLPGKYPHQVILYGQEEAAFALVTLTTGTSAKLIIDPAGFMPLCTQNVQSPCFLDLHCLFLDLGTELVIQFLVNSSCRQDLLILRIRIAHSLVDDIILVALLAHFCLCQKFSVTAQHNIRTTARHVGCNGHCTQLACLCHDLCLTGMLLCIQHIVLDALPGQHPGQQLGLFNGNGTNQHRLPLGMTLADLVDDGFKLALFGSVDPILVVDTLYRLIGGDGNHVQLVDFLELVFLGHCRTGHTGQLVVQTEVILECNGSQSLALVGNLHAFLCFDGLVQTVIEASAQHQTAGEFIHDDDFSVLDHIVDVCVHDAVCLQCLVDVMQQSHIVRIHQIFHVEVLLCLPDAPACDGSSLCLLVDDVIRLFVGFILIQLIVHFHHGGGSQSLGEFVHNRIQLCGLIPSAGNDQRGSCLIDQDGVHLIHDGKIVSALYLVLFINDHVITQVIKAQLIVGAVCNVAVVCFPALVIVQPVQDAANGQPHKTMHLAHFLGLGLCQIVIDCNDMNALAGQRIQIRCNACHQGLTFTGLHLGDSALMQYGGTDQLYRERTLAKHTVSRLPDCCKCLRKNIIQGLAVAQPLPELYSLFLQRCIGHGLIFILQIQHLVLDRFDPSQLLLAVGAENAFKNTHSIFRLYCYILWTARTESAVQTPCGAALVFFFPSHKHIT